LAGDRNINDELCDKRRNENKIFSGKLQGIYKILKAAVGKGVPVHIMETYGGVEV
jgi:hypothetical protein